MRNRGLVWVTNVHKAAHWSDWACPMHDTQNHVKIAYTKSWVGVRVTATQSVNGALGLGLFEIHLLDTTPSFMCYQKCWFLTCKKKVKKKFMDRSGFGLKALLGFSVTKNERKYPKMKEQSRFWHYVSTDFPSPAIKLFDHFCWIT